MEAVNDFSINPAFDRLASFMRSLRDARSNQNVIGDGQDGDPAHYFLAPAFVIPAGTQDNLEAREEERRKELSWQRVSEVLNAAKLDKDVLAYHAGELERRGQDCAVYESQQSRLQSDDKRRVEQVRNLFLNLAELSYKPYYGVRHEGNDVIDLEKEVSEEVCDRVIRNSEALRQHYLRDVVQLELDTGEVIVRHLFQKGVPRRDSYFEAPISRWRPGRLSYGVSADTDLIIQ
ncbi:hypothetical protein GMRT_14461 [Giardia muris]|uniref:Uncharacterized protein n=1 Tax=Giardia muris TaxID=5742 RepID=A0A4Z1SRC7_GIAMU|nr:hypothetical protein GMRT_14461 [Giardia muris]|eukprot:TNJ28270.1 hypothetical protein GMRT_14461 [Giardia muris]